MDGFTQLEELVLQAIVEKHEYVLPKLGRCLEGIKVTGRENNGTWFLY
jgi:hypothetical protein